MLLEIDNRLVKENQLTSVSDYKLKMFVHNNPKEAEKEISNWLYTNAVHIHHITQSQSEKGGNFVFVVSIYYS